MPAEQDTESPAGYDRLLNVAAGATTVAASVLGVFGIGTGIATALLRNNAEAMLTTTCVGAVGVLTGIVSAMVRTRATIGQQQRAVRIGALAAIVLLAAMWGLVGAAYAANGATTQANIVGWWLFLGGIVVASALLAWWLTRLAPLQMRNGLALAGLFLFGSAVVAVVVLAAASLRTTARPVIATEIAPIEAPAGYVTLTGTVTATGLSNGERYEIVVHLLDDLSNPTDPPQLLRTFAGPGADGNMTYKFTVTFAPEPDRPWIGVTARLADERPPRSASSSSCGIDERSLPEPGVTCAVNRVPQLKTG
jgi:hypothetical protein